MRFLNVKYIQHKRELLYYLFIVPQFLCVSWGVGSADFAYRVVFGPCCICLFLCMAGTSYNPREKFWICCITALSLVAFLKNGNRSLLLAIMAVFGCKDVDIWRLLKYLFWILVICLTLKVSMSAIGIVPNEVVNIPKDGEYQSIYCFGYSTPNNLYFHLVVCVLLAMVLYGQHNFVFVLAFSTVFMCGAYRILKSRSGFVCFLLSIFLYTLYYYLKKRDKVEVFLELLTISPVVLCLMNFGFIKLYGLGGEWIELLNHFLTGRLNLAWNAFFEYGITLTGSRGAVQLDMLYATMLLNYGIVLSGMCLRGYIKTMQRLCMDKQGMVTIAMSVLAVYSFMEVNAINPMWNPFILFLVVALFNQGRH